MSGSTTRHSGRPCARIGADGSNATLLGDADSFDVEPRISPDGGQVAFMRVHPEANYAVDIVVRDLASGDGRVVVPLDFPVEHPEWSPDGTSLVFNAQDGTPNAATIYTIDLNAHDAAPVVLLDPASGEGWGGVKPVYSPDGSRIVFVCTQGGEEGICRLPARVVRRGHVPDAGGHRAGGARVAPAARAGPGARRMGDDVRRPDAPARQRSPSATRDPSMIEPLPRRAAEPEPSPVVR
jgi:Tol biopolymer transport system component